jgi:peptidoglycan/xylan/chitin deacetylase (PgdA/CDA1 family)
MKDERFFVDHMAQLDSTDTRPPGLEAFVGGAEICTNPVFRERLRRRMGALTPTATVKHALAASFDVSGLNALLLSAWCLRLPWARALNYHDVPPRLASAFEEQLRFYVRHFVPVGPDELAELRAGRWSHAKPGLLLTFDDGLRSHAEVVAPLLEKFGFPGWFMVPVGFVDTPAPEQRAFARARAIPCDARPWQDGRIALSWDEVRRLDARHVICCHTYSHRRLGADLSAAELDHEIRGAKRRLEDGLGHQVRAFAWVGGEEWSYSPGAARVIRAAGFELGFMTNNAVVRPGCDPLQIQRTNVEATFPAYLMRFSLSGFFDLLYAPKRQRVNRLTMHEAV